jgi:hypothetical protein
MDKRQVGCAMEQSEPPEQPAKQAHAYKVIADDNFHHMDEEERYEVGVYSSCAEAIAVCKKVVDDFLLPAHKPGMTAEELWSLYTAFGDDAFIVSTDRRCRFSGWEYARQRCEALCEPQQDEEQGE